MFSGLFSALPSLPALIIYGNTATRQRAWGREGGCACRESSSFLGRRSPGFADRAANVYFVKNTNNQGGRREGQLLNYGPTRVVQTFLG